MRILVTGAAGFVGRHMIRELVGNGHEAVAFDMCFAEPVKDAVADVITGDLCDPTSVDRAVSLAHCDACVHLGAISFVPAGQANPALMFSVNVLGTLNVLEAFRKRNPAARILVVSTGHIYGTTSGICGGKEKMLQYLRSACMPFQRLPPISRRSLMPGNMECPQ